jgi:hypothetical protein
MSEDRHPDIEQLVSVPVFVFSEELPRGHLRIPKRMADEIARAGADGILFQAAPHIEVRPGDDEPDQRLALVGLTFGFVPAAKKA